MSKYDRYIVSYTDDRDGGQLSHSVEVLFEEEDNEARVIRVANRLLHRSVEIAGESIQSQLLDLEIPEFVELFTEVVIIQMTSMGNDKYQYANQLRDAINTAQNA